MSNKQDDSYLSCSLLANGGMVIAANEIRICCGGPLIGEYKYAKGQSIDDGLIQKWIAHRKELEKKLNSGIKCECSGCINLERKKWQSKQMGEAVKINILNMSEGYNCNLRCSYCSYVPNMQQEKTRANDEYALCVIQKLIEKKYLDSTCDVIFSVGEPLIQPFFRELLSLLMDNVNHLFINSNLTVYRKELEPYLEKNRVRITTSVDAGTRATYKKIRGRDFFEPVRENIRKYAQLNPVGILPKYICAPENCTVADRDGFLRLVQQSGISRIILSYDMMQEKVPSLVTDFYGEFKYRAGKMGLAVVEIASLYRESRDPVMQCTEQAYRNSLRKDEWCFSRDNAKHIAKGKGVLEYVLRANDKGLWIGGWAFDKVKRETARDIIVFWRDEALFRGICRWQVDYVAPDDKTGFSFHSTDCVLADKVLADPGAMKAYARFGDGEWYELENP